MGFAKYAEDNIKIMEERLSLRWEDAPNCQTIINTVCVAAQIVKIPSRKKKAKKIECCECGEEFIFTGGEQRFYKQHNLSEPKRCRKCRETRKEMYRQQKKEKKQ